jgi:anthranilate/para-aminobenzoate synthase component I
VTISALFSGDGWDLETPLLLSEPIEIWSANVPGDLPALLERLDAVAASGDADLLAACFFTYEAGVALEGSADLVRPVEGTPFAFVALFRISGDPRISQAWAGAPVPTSRPSPLAELRGPDDLTRARWAAAVAAIRDGIARGDVYQVNLTRRMRFEGSPDPYVLGAALFESNPVPLAITLATPDFAVVSNSPELFLDLDLPGRRAASAPIKGTVARGLSAGDDAAAVERLLASAKDAAEHLMIVDLVRNDLGRVAVPGGVAVPDFRTVRSFRHLHHLESTVAARLPGGVSLSHVLAALLPAGSITGAPKRSALRFIRELEPHPRGPYTGAAGYVRGSGRAVLNVAIRTAILSRGRVDYHAGGGIVWDSDPEAEWRETETKSAEFAASVARLNAEREVRSER